MEQSSAKKYAAPTAVVYNANTTVSYSIIVDRRLLMTDHKPCTFATPAPQRFSVWGIRAMIFEWLICGYGGLAPKATPVHASVWAGLRLCTLILTALPNQSVSAISARRPNKHRLDFVVFTLPSFYYQRVHESPAS